jgi:quinol monooxygenase YgiN
MDQKSPLEPVSQRQQLSRRFLVQAAAALGATAPFTILTNTAEAETMETPMMLATTTVADVDQFLKVFSTTSLAKRKQHGSKGASVYRDPNQADRVWVIFDWDVAGFKQFATDPDVPAIMKEAGHTAKPQIAEFANHFTA